MNRPVIPLLEWSHQELLSRLSQVAPHEWVCHIHSGQQSDGTTYLESTFSTLILHADRPWKVTAARRRLDSSTPADPLVEPSESYLLGVQRLAPLANPAPVLDGAAAMRAFHILKTLLKQALMSEAVSSELCFEDLSAQPVPVAVGTCPGYQELLYAIDNLPPSRWKINFVQHGGGPIDFCERRLSAELESLKLSIGENMLARVDAPTAAAAGIHRYHLEVRQHDGSRVSHPLTPSEVEQLYAATNQRITRSLPRRRA